MIEATTSLKKISSMGKRIKVIQGGQGAGKTFSVLLILINHALKNSNKDIYISSFELSKMRITVIKDFLNIMHDREIFNKANWKDGKTYTFENNSRISFIGLDKEDIGKGLRSDVMFINEANKIKFETYRQLTSRAKKVIIDYNPDSLFWVHSEVLDRNDASFISLTYKDNEFLDINEVNEIELNKTKAYINPDLPNPDRSDNVKSKYYQNKWHVYGLGKVGTNPNRIFFWNECSVEEYQNLEVPVYYGVDWGTVDPMGIIEVKYYDGKLFLRELNYLSENELRERLTPEQNAILAENEEGLIKWLFSRLDINKTRPIICDNNRPDKIKALRRMGFEYALRAQKGKGSILDGIDLVSGIEVYYTADSENIKNEQENYARKKDRYDVVLEEPEDKNNHLMDPTRYVANFLLKEGIIKTI